MMSKFKQTVVRYFQIFPWIGYGFLLSLAVGTGYGFNWQNWTSWILSTTLFVLGSWLGTVVFVFEPQINSLIERAGSRLAHENEAAPPSSQFVKADQSASQTMAPAHSWLRSNTVLLMLPILALYLLTSSKSAAGFGFMFGISLTYLVDIWKFSQGKFPDFLNLYFYQSPTRNYLKSLIFGYSFYFVIFCLLLIIL